MEPTVKYEIWGQSHDNPDDIWIMYPDLDFGYAKKRTEQLNSSDVGRSARYFVVKAI